MILLDVGVWGLHIPQVDTPEIDHEVAQAARYAPVGMRGMAGLGMKSLGGNGQPITQGVVTVEEALRYAKTVASRPWRFAER